MEELTSKPYVIGLDLGGTNSVFGIVDARGDIKANTAIKTGGYSQVDDYVQASVQALQPILEQVGGIGKSIYHSPSGRYKRQGATDTGRFIRLRRQCRKYCWCVFSQA